LEAKIREKGYSVIPLKIYFKGGKAKIAIGLARGKKLYDKRHAIKEREMKREMDRVKRKNY
jgi:SsrA-binding protein